MNPTTRLLLWLEFLIAVQYMNGPVLAGAFLAVPLLGARVWRRAWRLIVRSRWLLVSLFTMMAWGSAGHPLWDGALAPSREGVADAATHLGRLLLVLIAVATLLEAMSVNQLVAALHALTRPWHRFGAERGVVRLLLVLRYVESLPRPRDWRVLLDAPTPTAAEAIEISVAPLAARDYALTAACALLLGALVAAGGLA